jgi:streptogramin lyase
MWFTASTDILRVTPDGTATAFSLPGNVNGNSESPIGIAAGPDGNIWFTSTNFYGSCFIGRLTL